MKRIMILLVCFFSITASVAQCASLDNSYTEKSYTINGEQITGIAIDVRDRQIEVALSADNQIRIGYFENSKEYYNIFVSEDNILTMTPINDKAWSDYIGKIDADHAQKIFLELPETLLTVLQLSTTNKDIVLSPLTKIDHISLSTNNGNIEFVELNAGNTITLNAKNGNIKGSIQGAYEEYSISSKIKKGEKNLPTSKESGIKKLAVTNNNGDIDIDFTGK